MQALLDLLKDLWSLFIWWFVVQPWERALRVRAGDKITEFGPGLHFRIPFYDVVYRQSTRLHFSSIEPQTVTTEDGAEITFAGTFGYVIEDLNTLYMTMQSPDTTVQAIVTGALAQYIQTHAYAECTPDVVEAAVCNDVDIEKYGLKDPQLFLTTYAKVKTYRLIMDEHGLYSASPGLHNAEPSAAGYAHS